MAKKLEKPITDYKEYKKRLRRVKIITVLSITIPSVLILCALIIFFSGGRVLKIFGVTNFRLVMNVFYGGFYVITGIVVVIVLIFAVIFVVKAIIDYIKGLKNK